MFPILQPAPISQRKQGDSVRTRLAQVPVRTRPNDATRAADMNARLRQAAKKAFWLIGED